MDIDTGATGAAATILDADATGGTGVTGAADVGATGATGSVDLGATGATADIGATGSTAQLPDDAANAAAAGQQIATGLPQAVLDNNAAAQADLAATIGATVATGDAGPAIGATAVTQPTDQQLADANAQAGIAPASDADLGDEIPPTPQPNDIETRVSNLEDQVRALFDVVESLTSGSDEADQGQDAASLAPAPSVRAKFTCTAASDYPTVGPRQYRTVGFMAAVSGDENKAWASATPSGSLSMVITNLDAADLFEVGKSYFLDFTPAD